MRSLRWEIGLTFQCSGFIYSLFQMKWGLLLRRLQPHEPRSFIHRLHLGFFNESAPDQLTVFVTISRN